MRLVLLWVGRTRDSRWRALEEEYLLRLRRFTPAEMVLLRNSTETAAAAARDDESLRLQQRIPQASIVLVLDERGEELDSLEFARWMETQAASGARTMTIVAGGPYGVADPLRQKAHRLLSLSRMTWTHEMSRVMILEQLYRAFSIMRGHPYHHK